MTASTYVRRPILSEYSSNRRGIGCLLCSIDARNGTGLIKYACELSEEIFCDGRVTRCFRKAHADALFGAQSRTGRMTVQWKGPVQFRERRKLSVMYIQPRRALHHPLNTVWLLLNAPHRLCVPNEPKDGAPFLNRCSFPFICKR